MLIYYIAHGRLSHRAARVYLLCLVLSPLVTLFLLLHRFFTLSVRSDLRYILCRSADFI